MNQIPLNLTPRLSYAPEQFVRHAGVSQLYQEISALILRPEFHLIVIRGDERAGKTHLSIALSDSLGREGRFPRLLEGESETSIFTRELAEPRFASANNETVYLIDDADHAFQHHPPGNSGPFVTVVEELRRRRAKLVLFVTTPALDLPCDDHVLSRIREGSLFEIGAPRREEVFPLVRALALQRGLRFDDRELAYIDKRVGSDIPSIERYLVRLDYLTRTSGRPIDFLSLRDSM